MTESERGPKRLFAEDDPLLDAARHDVPPNDLEGRILAIMGGPPPANGGGGGSKSFWKVGLGAVVGAGVLVLAARSTPAPVPPIAPPPTLVTSALAPIESAPVPREETKVETIEKVEPVPAPSILPAIATPSKPRPSASIAIPPAPSVQAAPKLGLAAEIKALDGARASMNGGDARAALTALDAYDREFPSGTLGQEAALLRIDALMRAGRADDARTLGHTFLAEHPSTPHKKRILTLLHEVD